MSDEPRNDQTAEPDPAGGPRIGVDEWVARADERREQGGFVTRLLRPLDRIPMTVRVIIVVALLLLLPRVNGSDYVHQVAFNAGLLALLALGLNVVVGFAGLLDLGYIAFYGFGAYLFAELASPQLGHHWPTLPALFAVMIVTGLLGTLIGLPSRRLVGDYFAIVTLFFGQLFVTMMLNLDRIHFPGRDQPTDLTGGPNGIVGVDWLRIPGELPWTFGDWIPNRIIESVADYYYVIVILFGLVMIATYRLKNSRTGRAWRAVHDDPLAAAQMTIPVFRLRILAFAIGAGIAGLTGAVFASQQISVFPTNFDVTVLITVYAAVILGGEGSPAGVALGAVAVAVLPEILRDPDKAELLFYGTVLIVLVMKLRPWLTLLLVLAGTVAFGFAARAVVEQVWPSGNEGASVVESRLGDWIAHWMVYPEDPTTIGNVAFVVTIVSLLSLTTIDDRRIQAVLLVPLLWLAAFTWENRLIVEPTTTRLILFGALLVLMMIARPQGFLGKPRVETV